MMLLIGKKAFLIITNRVNFPLLESIKKLNARHVIKTKGISQRRRSVLNVIRIFTKGNIKKHVMSAIPSMTGSPKNFLMEIEQDSF